MYVYIYIIYIYICLYVYAYVCVHVYVCVYVCIYMYVHMFMHVYECIYYQCICMCACMYMHTVCIYTLLVIIWFLFSFRIFIRHLGQQSVLPFVALFSPIAAVTIIICRCYVVLYSRF